MPVGLSVHQTIHRDTPKKQMEIVFPCETDTGKYLRTTLDDIDPRVSDPGHGHAHDLTSILPSLLHGSHSGRDDRFAGLQRKAHVGELVLHRLEGPDGPAEGRAIDG